jgi:hypothetical protein
VDPAILSTLQEMKPGYVHAPARGSRSYDCDFVHTAVDSCTSTVHHPTSTESSTIPTGLLAENGRGSGRRQAEHTSSDDICQRRFAGDDSRVMSCDDPGNIVTHEPQLARPDGISFRCNSVVKLYVMSIALVRCLFGA